MPLVVLDGELVPRLTVLAGLCCKVLRDRGRGVNFKAVGAAHILSRSVVDRKGVWAALWESVLRKQNSSWEIILTCEINGARIHVQISTSVESELREPPLYANQLLPESVRFDLTDKVVVALIARSAGRWHHYGCNPIGTAIREEGQGSVYDIADSASRDCSR